MRVLLGTDGSPDAVLATEWLAAFPVPPESSIRVVSVVPRLPSGAQSIMPHREALQAHARQVADSATRTLAPKSVEAHVVTGDVRAALLQAAEDWRAELIVLGARGLGGLERVLLGSVSLGIARDAPCAVMIVKGTARRLQRAVVGLDGSDSSRAALRFFAGLPLVPDTEVLLVGVAEKIYFPRSAPALIAEPLLATIAQIEAEEKARKQECLVEAERLLKGTTRVQLESVVGEPADEILRAAATSRAQLIVLGSRGLGGVQRVMLGSVSERVLLQAECAVLIVKH